jgi:peptide/nickel transport system substrate-binding protein
MNIVAEDWTIYLPKVIAGDFTTTILGNSGLADPDDYLYDNFHSDGSGNFGKFSNAEIDALLVQGRQASDPAERKTIYAQAQELILDEAPHVFLFYSAQYEALRNNVKGFKHYQNTGYLSFKETWLE